MDEYLKYLFVAEYEDGTFFGQPENDISAKDPNTSAFADVDHSKLVKFHLIGNGYVYSVDLVTGLFYVNEVAFGAYDEDVEIKKRKLVYFRRNWKPIVASAGSVQEIPGRQTFHIGWNGRGPNGEIIERTIWVE